MNTITTNSSKCSPNVSLPAEVFLRIMELQDSLCFEFQKMFKEEGLTLAQYNMLRILRGVENGRLPCHEIKRRLIQQVPDITRLVDRLEDAGLVYRKRCENDRRVIYIEISQKGLHQLAKLDEPVEELHQRQFSDMSEEELSNLNEMLIRAQVAFAAHQDETE